MADIYTRRVNGMQAGTCEYISRRVYGKLSDMPERFSGTGIKDIAARIIATREAMGMASGQFALFCQISPQALANYETGLRRPDIDQAGKLAAAGLGD